MTPDRAYAYRRVMHTLRDLGPAKLAACEQERIRLAVDNLIFSHNLEDDVAASDALRDINSLCRALVESGRWQEARAMRLASDVSQCGPPPPVELEAA